MPHNDLWQTRTSDKRGAFCDVLESLQKRTNLKVYLPTFTYHGRMVWLKEEVPWGSGQQVMLASAAGRLLEIIYFCRSSRLSSGIILPLNLGVLEPDCSMEALTGSQCWVKRTAPGEGWGREVCWQFERHFKHSPDKFADQWGLMLCLVQKGVRGRGEVAPSWST